ncbi:MAG: DEAD/DEAH box helicase [Candidatus Thiodiazotropha sp.]
MGNKVLEITVNLLQQACGLTDYKRGIFYFRQGSVIELQVLQSDSERIVLKAVTEGNGPHHYQQEINIFKSGQDTVFDNYCNCPAGPNCEHVVAACLSFMQSKKGRRRVNSSAAFNDWLKQFSADDQGDEDEEGNRGSLEALIYTLKPRGNSHSVKVDFCVARRKRDGSFGKGRQTNPLSLNRYFNLPGYLQQLDKEILALLSASNRQWGVMMLSGASGSLALKLMLSTGRVFWEAERLYPLRLAPKRDLLLKWEDEKRGFQLRIDGLEHVIMVPVTPPLFIDTERYEVGEWVLPAGIDSEQLHLIDIAPPIPRKAAKRLSRQLALKHPELPTPVAVDITDMGLLTPTPRLTIGYRGSSPLGANLALDFLYQDIALDADSSETTMVTVEQSGELVRFQRDLVAEAAAGERLRAEGLAEQPGQSMHFTLPHREAEPQSGLAVWFQFMEEGIKRLRDEGWQIELAEESPIRLSRAELIEAEVERTDNDWFELRFDIEVKGHKLPLLPLVIELIGDYEPGSLPPTLYLTSGDGHYVEVASERVEPILQNIIEIYDTLGENSKLYLSRLDAPRLLELGDLKVKGGQALQRLAAKLKNFEGIKPAKLPITFKGKLRDYQQLGVDWLQFLREYELAGILADDMGLGKTVQTLAHLAIEKRAGRMHHPSLIIAPTSLMGNWRREAQLFTPKLRVLVLQGPNRSGHFDNLCDYDLILTTYPLLPRDRDVILGASYHYLILDEAQQIKNPRSQAAKLVREIQADHRLCLTGTPMENHLGELWAQFDFLLPGFLGSQDQFVRNYRTPIEKQGDHQRMQRLSRRIKPFMLRRIKEQVAKDLPLKSELLRTTPIEGRQAMLYESIRLTMEKRVRKAISTKGLARSQITILDALLKLRQVCCDPRLLPMTKGQRQAPSAKLNMLLEMLPELLDEGRRILLFSQFTSMLGLIELSLAKEKISYTKLTGQTRKRDEAIELFRSGQVNLFLISLKAGGVGLNLTEADTVIHYDPWWNPAIEMQATDRAHRIGQEKPVFVYKLITEGTVEEKILALQAKKQLLADSVYGEGKKEQEILFDADTINELLSG